MKIILLIISLSSGLLFSENIWQPTNGPYGGFIEVLSVNKKGVMIAVTKSYTKSKNYKSTDGGNNWIDIGRDSITSIKLMSDGRYIVGKRAGNISLYDEEFNFIKILREGYHSEANINRIIITNKGVILAFDEWHGGYVSSDTGQSWVSKQYYNGDYYIDAVDSSNNYYSFGYLNNFYRLSDKDTIWEKIQVFDTTEIPNNSHVKSLCYNIKFNTLVAYYSEGQVFVSTNNGDLWIKTLDSMALGSGYAGIIADDNGVLYLSGDNYLFSSSDGGYVWNRMLDSNKRLISAVVPYQQHIYYLGYEGINDFDLKTNEIKEINHGIINSSINSVTVSPNAYIFACGSTGIFRSTNEGNEWEKLKIEVGLYPSNYMKIYADKKGDVFLSLDSLLFKSTDYGLSWEKLGFSHDIMISDFKITDNGRIYIATYGLYHSDDEGKTWIQDNLPLGSYSSVDVANEKYIIVGSVMSNSQFSSDGGTTWNSCTPVGIEQAGSTVKFTKNLNIILFLDLYQSGSYAYISRDTGRTFQVLKTPNKYYEGFMLQSADENIYISVHDKYLYISPDLGNTWHTISRGLEDVTFISCLAYNERTYYLGTFNDGIYICRNFSEIDEDCSHSNNGFMISPNPAEDYIEISYPPSEKRGLGGVSVRIYDVLGTEVTTPSLRDTPPYQGGEIVRIEISGLAPGVYFVRVGDVVRKFVKM